MLVGVLSPDADGFATFVLNVFVFVWPPGVVTFWLRLITMSPFGTRVPREPDPALALLEPSAEAAARARNFSGIFSGALLGGISMTVPNFSARAWTGLGGISMIAPTVSPLRGTRLGATSMAPPDFLSLA